MIIAENEKQILQTLVWIETIQTHEGATIATADHRSGLKLLADEFCLAIEEIRQLRAKLDRKGTGRRKASSRCLCGQYAATERSQKKGHTPERCPNRKPKTAADARQ